MKVLRFAVFVWLVPGGVAHAFSSKKPAPEPERIQLGEPSMNDSKTSPAVPGQYLISFEASVSASDRAELFKKWGVKELEKVGSTPLYLIEVPSEADAKATLKGLKASPGVRYVEANLKMQTFGP